MDIALAVEEIYPAAQFRMCHTYEELVRTWSDERPVPSREALDAAWKRVQSKTVKAAALNALKETDVWMSRLLEDWIAANSVWDKVPQTAKDKFVERLKRRKTFDSLSSLYP